MKCNECNLCCKLLNIPWMNSPANTWCKNCNVGVGCEIYKTAPKKCLNFCCAYNQMEDASLNLRPDNCGVIFEKVTNNIFLGTVNPNEMQLKDIVKIQIKHFLNENISVVLLNSKIKKPFIYNSEKNTKKIVWEIFQQEALKRYNSFII